MVGASLRSIDSEGFVAHANCWMASEDLPGYEVADTGTRRALDVMGKLLRRGTAPPLHPSSERGLIESAGLGHLLVPNPLPGDVAPVLRQPPRIDPEAFTWPLADGSGVNTDLSASDEVRILVDSDEEGLLIEWMAERHPESARWLLPQASFDGLLQAAGQEATGCRRCDFLWAPPGTNPIVIEVDGRQHDNQKLVDEDRDRQLARIGIAMHRVSTREVRDGHGPLLDAIATAIGRGPTQLELGLQTAPGKAGGLPLDKQRRLVWGAIQTHRLVLGLCEAIRRGFLSGDRWIVHVEDPTGGAVEHLGPYLDALHALDRLWGSGAAIAGDVLLIGNGSSVRFHRGSEGRYGGRRDSGKDPVLAADALILLQCDRTPIQPLPDGTDTPTVVIRSTGIGLLLSDPLDAGTDRITARVNGDDARNALRVVLRTVFAKEDFREGQFEAISEVMAGRDCAVLLPTGAGKSLIYQLAGLCLPGLTLVVDPLVALAKDQLRVMRRDGIERVEMIAGSLTPNEVAERLQGKAGANPYFVIVTPERFQSQHFRTHLAALTARIRVNLAVVDEAHCVTEWGHDFRPSYLNLGRVLRDHCDKPPLLALTGTASRPVLRDVLLQLDIAEVTEHSIVFPKTFDRDEFHFSNIRVSKDRMAKDQATLQAELERLPRKHDKPLGSFFEPNGEQTSSGLIFCPTKGEKGWHNVKDTATLARDVIPSIQSYAGEMISAGDRFIANSVTALATTNAFGMGIDKPNIRWIIHYMLPRSIEAYYQEVGRAGRDGKPAECILILTEYDTERNRILLSEDIDIEEVRTEVNNGPWAERDDVRQALWFLLGAFVGVEDELAVLVNVAEQLRPGPRRHEREIPGNSGNDDKSREKALHRLAVLGVVDDYLKHANKFTVTVNSVLPDHVVDRLEDFIMRHEPGRGQSVRDGIGDATDDLLAVIEACGGELIRCIYRNVVKARRHSLREMWQLAHRARGDQQIRDWITGFLTEGFLSAEMVKLAEKPVFRYGDWVELWLDKVKSDDEELELLFGARRLRTYYPNHPGLLASCALAEALVPGDERRAGDPREFELALIDSLRLAAGVEYGSDRDDIDRAMFWIRDKTTARRVGWAAGLVGAAHYAGVLSTPLAEWADSAGATDWHLAPFPLAIGIESARDLARSALDIYEGE